MLSHLNGVDAESPFSWSFRRCPHCKRVVESIRSIHSRQCLNNAMHTTSVMLNHAVRFCCYSVLMMEWPLGPPWHGATGAQVGLGTPRVGANRTRHRDSGRMGTHSLPQSWQIQASCFTFLMEAAAGQDAKAPRHVRKRETEHDFLPPLHCPSSCSVQLIPAKLLKGIKRKKDTVLYSLNEGTCFDGSSLGGNDTVIRVNVFHVVFASMRRCCFIILMRTMVRFRAGATSTCKAYMAAGDKAS